MAARRPSKIRDRREREAHERARLHAARAEWHASRIRRRTRDNLIAGIAGGLIVIGAFASQTVHAQVAPVPTPTPTSTIEPSGPPAPQTPDPETPTPTPGS